MLARISSGQACIGESDKTDRWLRFSAMMQSEQSSRSTRLCAVFVASFSLSSRSVSLSAACDDRQAGGVCSGIEMATG